MLASRHDESRRRFRDPVAGAAMGLQRGDEAMPDGEVAGGFRDREGNEAPGPSSGRRREESRHAARQVLERALDQRTPRAGDGSRARAPAGLYANSLLKFEEGGGGAAVVVVVVGGGKPLIHIQMHNSTFLLVYGIVMLNFEVELASQPPTKHHPTTNHRPPTEYRMPPCKTPLPHAGEI